MPIDSPGLWQQVALGEDTALELKGARFRGDRVVGPRRDDLADGLAALANGRGGRLVLGATDERRPQGLDPAQLDALANLVTEICSDAVKPPLDFSLFRVPAPGPAEPHVPLRGRHRRQRGPDPAGALRSERAGPADGLVRGERHRVVPGDGRRLVRLRLPLHRVNDAAMSPPSGLRCRSHSDRLHVTGEQPPRHENRPGAPTRTTRREPIANECALADSGRSRSGYATPERRTSAPRLIANPAPWPTARENAETRRSSTPSPTVAGNDAR